MPTRTPLPVDLFDPQDIRAKLPDIRRIYVSKREELEKLTEQVRGLGEMVELLARLANDATDPLPSTSENGDAPSRRVAPGQERAIAALERAGRPMGPAALFHFMLTEQMDTPANANALGANLWSAERAGRIKKVKEGAYAPLSWQPPGPVIDYRVAAQVGVPVPEQIPNSDEIVRL